MLGPAEAEALVRGAAGAMQAGQPEKARAPLEQVIASGRASAQVWLIYAVVCRALGDFEALEKAADILLARDPDSLRGLILKGDSRRGLDDDRAAASFYRRADVLAAGAETLPADLTAEVERARTAAAEIDEGFRERLAAHLGKADLADGGGARFRESIDILEGRRQVYFQQPTAYFFPGLPQIQFYDPADFPWAARLEAASETIRSELDAVLSMHPDRFRPYLQARADRPAYDFHGLLDNPEWSTLYLWENGGPVPGNTELFPKTMRALRDVPMPRITTRAPSILFSLLKAGARIAPHHGVLNPRLICHLPLIVPPNCGFRCGNETRAWEPGRLLIFDDTIEHEAWNNSKEDRIVLIFDIWRPELGFGEREAVSSLFEAIDS